MMHPKFEQWLSEQKTTVELFYLINIKGLEEFDYSTYTSLLDYHYLNNHMNYNTWIII
jgi:hypothetical protein